MRAEVNQPPTLGPGFALITVKEAPPLDPATLSFSVEHPPRGFLQETVEPAWGTTHAWLKPNSAIVTSDGLELTLGPERTWPMRPHVTYVLRLQDASSPTPVAARIAWKAIRMPSQPPERVVAPAPPAADDTGAVAPGPASAAEPESTIPGPIAPPLESPPKPQQRGFRPMAPVPLLLLLLVSGGAAAWFFTHDKPPPGVVSEPPPVPPMPDVTGDKPLDPAAARAFLQTTPSGNATYAEAERYLKDGSPDALQGALILLSRAAESGSAAAETALGRMYDPDTFAPDKSAMKAPDSSKALLWYERAAKSNDREGLYRLF